MSRYQFELATPADDADLRRVLAETPMPGTVSLSFRREPSYFDAAVVDGRFRQIVAARDLTTRRIIGFGSRSIGERYVNGRPEAVGYLSNLRLHHAHRNRRLVARGYAFFRDLHSDGKARLYLTTIAADNAPAIKLLTSQRAGLPAYHFAGSFHTFAIPRGWPRKVPAGNGRQMVVRPAQPEDLAAALAFWNTVGPRRQFFPCLSLRDFFSPQGAFRDLQPGDLLLAYCDGSLAGTLAGWDQTAFRQTVVASYRQPLRWARPLVNAWASLRGLPRLPRPGSALRYLTAALFVVADDDFDCARILLDALLERTSQETWDYLLVGLHEADLLRRALDLNGATVYTTNLYLVCWEDGEELRQSLDGRPPYLELGTL